MTNTTVDTEVTAPATWVDSDGTALEVGDRVHVSLKAAKDTMDTDWNYVEGRKFDFGTVEGRNDDGTYSVFWDSAGCSCNSDEVGRDEPADQITKASDVSDQIWDLALAQGFEDGVKNAQTEIRYALGLEDEDK